MPDWMKRNLLRLTVLLLVSGLVYEVRHAILTVRPMAPETQRITLLNPSRPPEPPQPPEPEVKQPEAEQPAAEVKQQFFKFDDYAPGPAGPAAKGPPGPSSDSLGLDTQGGQGSDTFGLVGKPGGRDITTLGPEVGGSGAGGPGGQGGGGGPMAKFAPYAYRLRDTITAALNAHPELRVANYDAILQIWINPDGGIKRVALAKSTGTAKMDAALRDAVANIQRFSLATPPDMPQPVDLRIVSKGASGFAESRPKQVN